MNQRGIFTGLCPLCGARSAGSYCAGCAWANGETPVENPEETALESQNLPLDIPERLWVLMKNTDGKGSLNGVG